MATRDADLNNDGTITKREMNSYNSKNPNSPVSNKDRQAYNQRNKDKQKTTNPASELNLQDLGILAEGGAQIVIKGFGELETFGDSVPGSSFAGKVSQFGDLTINSASKLKYLFEALRQDNDPRLKAWYKQAGFANWDDAKKVWDKAADQAYKIAQGRGVTGNPQNVDFFQLMGSKKFLKTLFDSGTGRAPAGPMTYTTLTDPATAKSDLIKMMKSVAGRPPTDQEINEYIKKLNAAQKKATTTVFQGQTIQSRFDEEEFLMNFVVSKTEFTGALKPGMARQALDTLTMSINAFGVGSYITDDKKNKWAKQLLTGEMTQEELGQRLSELASKAFPAFADVIGSNPGVNMRDLFDDYISVYASMLELDPDTIDIKDVLGKSASLSQDGNYTKLSLFDLEKSLRNDPRYTYTKRAHQEAASFGASVARSMGVNL